MDRLVGTVKNRQVCLLQIRGSLDGFLSIDESENLLFFLLAIPQSIKSPRNGIVHDFENPTPHELLVLDQRDVGLHPRRITVHHKRDSPCGSQDRYLSVSKSMGLTLLDRLLPHLADGTQEFKGNICRIYLGNAPVVFSNHLKHWPPVRLKPIKAAHGRGDFSRGQIGLPGHKGWDSRCIVSSRIAIIGKAPCHQQSTEVGKSQPQGSVSMTVLGNRLCWIPCVVHNDFLGENHHLHSLAKSGHIELSLLVQKPQEI